MTRMNRTVLVVDDQENWRDLLAEILAEEFDVIAVTDYQHAMEELQRNMDPYHVVITDMRLVDTEKGNEDGLRLIDHLNQHATKTKTIVVTGYPTFPSQRKAFSKLAVHDYLEKHPSDGSGFNKDEFLSVVREAATEAERNRNNLVFVLMPFDLGYVAFYENEIKQTIEGMHLVCKRADDFFGPRPIMDDILESIQDAKFIIADLSGRNPNVFFEVGISHALGKNVILLTQNLADVPPKLQTLRCIIYERSFEGATELIPALEKAVTEVQETGNPVLVKRNELRLQRRSYMAVVPVNDVPGQSCDHIVRRAMKEANFTGGRSDEIFDSSSMLEQIWAHLNAVDLVIADLTSCDSDVFYMAGLAYGLGKNIIYLARDETDITFDLRSASHIIYSSNPYESGLDAQKKITRVARELFG